MKIISWNVNGIRAVMNKGFLDFLEEKDPDILCVQETKISPSQLTQELINPLGYYSQWNSAQRPGYSGTATFSKEKPLSVSKGLGEERFDTEGRCLLTEFPGFMLVNLYIPNGGQGTNRLKFKMDYYDALLEFLEEMRKNGRNLVICGDINTAHNEIDLARPLENQNVSGFLPIERAWMDKFLGAGYVDVFRHLNPGAPDNYTWWSYRTAARERNVGWRIDYFFVNEEFVDSVKSAEILRDVIGSDHCPVQIEID
ncbi:exodeoxyribonuclease III [Patescibacteria group bacterium]|nr:exodeoxyribonuclease III [Patescibacteria group bacterium]